MLFRSRDRGDPANAANQSEPEEVPETVETPVIPATQSEPEEVPVTVETPAIPVNQSEPQEVPETMQILALQLIRANQMRAQRPWRSCHSS